MAILQAQHIIQMKSFIPADAVVNTFYFLTPGDVVLPTELDDIVTAIKEFYDTPNPVGLSVGIILSEDVSVNLRVIKIRKKLVVGFSAVLRETTYTSTQPGGSGAHPHEVALVLSYRGQVSAGEVQRRRRGRIYLGPLSNQSSLSEQSAGDVRPTAGVRTALTQAGARLRDRPTGPIWATLSTVDGVARPVVNGWCDNAYDTQRRRGTKAVTRTTF